MNLLSIFKGQGYHKGCNHRKFRHCSGTDDGSCPECTDADLKKQPSKILNQDLYQTVVTSYTKGTSYELTFFRIFISENDHVLIIDDFLANGEAATGAIRLIRKAHATIAGVGILIEKSFQPGYEKLTEQGIDVYSLARIAKLGERCDRICKRLITYT